MANPHDGTPLAPPFRPVQWGSFRALKCSQEHVDVSVRSRSFRLVEMMGLPGRPDQLEGFAYYALCTVSGWDPRF